MAHNQRASEAQILENYQVALTNAENQPEIAAALTEIGYDETVIAEGKTLLATTNEVYNKNKQEDNETLSSRAAFDQKFDEVVKMYAEHRKIAKVIFRNNAVALKQLGLTGSIPQVYINRVETMKALYSGGSDLLGQLQRLNIKTEDIEAASASVVELENLRAEYLREIGESQDATKTKDSAFAKIDDWMRDFYAVAKIALEDKPQLLEALGMLVRS